MKSGWMVRTEYTPAKQYVVYRLVSAECQESGEEVDSEWDSNDAAVTRAKMLNAKESEEYWKYR